MRKYILESTKERRKGDKYFIDYPIKINNKIIFDGSYFLAERRHYVVKNVFVYISGMASERKRERVESNVLCLKNAIKIRPNVYLNGQWKYSQWGKKQDEGSRCNSFGDDLIKKIKSIKQLNNARIFYFNKHDRNP